ncbi:venom serine carboxypeptidase-like [Haemaphysalis longicornis]
MTAEERVLRALRLYATGTFHGSVGSDHTNDRPQSTVSRLPVQDGSVEASLSKDKKAGDPLFLTPLIKKGRLDEALSMSKVKGLPADVDITSYAGYITVNQKFRSNLFFWFVPSLSDPQNAPVVLWLQGGPGTTSLLGFFSGNGPYRVSNNGTLAEFRQVTWAQRYSMLYVDQPVGTGFSYTEKEAGYARNVSDASRDMLEFLQQFFTLFGDLAQNEFYVTGESYAGKYVPTLAAAVHENAGTMRVKINLRGIAIGNGWTDLINSLGFGEFLYGIGLADRLAAYEMTQVEHAIIGHIRRGSTAAAVRLLDSLLLGIETNVTFFNKVTGYSYLYNYLLDKEPADVRDYKKFVPRPEVRRALHVGQRPFSTTRDVVYDHFIDDFMRSAVPQLTVVLENGYRVLLYSGMLDIAIPPKHSERFLSRMIWSRALSWARAPQRPWHSTDGQVLYGYTRRADNLNFVVLRNSGHMVPYDQPQISLNLITAFIDGNSPFEQ